MGTVLTGGALLLIEEVASQIYFRKLRAEIRRDLNDVQERLEHDVQEHLEQHPETYPRCESRWTLGDLPETWFSHLGWYESGASS